MANYTKVFTKPYADGYEDLPSQNTPITAQTLNDKDDAIVNIETYLAGNDIPSDAEGLSYDNTDSGLTADNVQSAIDELNDEKVDKTGVNVKTNTTGQFNTITGGLMLSCVVDLEPIQSGSGTPSPSNVRAISGHTQVQVGNVGKNLLETILSDIKTANTNGTWSGNAYTLNGVTFTVEINTDGNVVRIKVNGVASQETTFNVGLTPATGTFVMNGCPNGGSVSTYSVYAKNLYVHDYGTGANITTSGTRVTVAIVIRNGYTANNLIFKPMIRKATGSADFEPYNGYTTTINLGNTYYGGTLDAVSGVLTVTHGLATFNGDNTVNRNYVGSSITQFLLPQLPTDAKIGSTLSVSNELVYSNNTNIPYIFQITRAGTSTPKILFTLPNSIATTIEEASAWLTSNPLQIAYELATPQTIQLTPTQLETLVGQNDVFAPLEGQTVESVEYREVMTWDDVNKAVEFTDANNLINAVKVGKTVTVNIACDSFAMVGRVSEDAWDYITSEALPEEMRPQKTIHANILNILTLGGGYSITSIPCRINTTGIIEAFMLHQQTAQPYGTITYVIK